MKQARIAIVGSGNLAWHLAGVLPDRAVVISRDGTADPSWPVKVLGYDDLPDLDLSAIFLAVPDNAIGPVSSRLATTLPTDLPVYHTSGATPVGRIDGHFRHRGVLWPIRSLREGEPVKDWKDLPLVVSGTTDLANQLVTGLAQELSDTVAVLDDRQRAQLHLAAVFSNNFVTALYEVAFQLCREYDVPFDLLLPIIRNTAQRQDGSQPALSQTGAAARGDTATMERHESLLTREQYRQLYRDMSRLILEYRLPQHDPDLRGDTDDGLQNEGIA